MTCSILVGNSPILGLPTMAAPAEYRQWCTNSTWPAVIIFQACLQSFKDLSLDKYELNFSYWMTSRKCLKTVTSTHYTYLQAFGSAGMILVILTTFVDRRVYRRGHAALLTANELYICPPTRGKYHLGVLIFHLGIIRYFNSSRFVRNAGRD